MALNEKPAQYEKHHSFDFFYSNLQATSVPGQISRAIRIVETSEYSDFENGRLVLDHVLESLKKNTGDTESFKITGFIADEMRTIPDADIPRYLYHRCRYDIFPTTKQVDDFPPLIQIEPVSYCNYRCVFCFQTDPYFHKKSSPQMGTMSLDMFKDIIDQIEGKVEFINLASRGEPFLSKDICQMLEYCSGKFLNLKVNTNASALQEKHIHSILSGGVNTIVFSADAADEELYSQLRVNGKLSRVLKKIETFKKIRDKYYPDLDIISRVSGVLVDSQQNMDEMKELWGGLVDQISFVRYNPWENVYDAKPNTVEDPCSDLWRRMFIWHDGVVNPCDTDYKSTLQIGDVTQNTIQELWRGANYQKLRNSHQCGHREQVEPCRRCVVV